MRTMDEDDPSILDPIFRCISFSDTAVVCTVAHFLRLAWTQNPPDDMNVADDASIKSWLSNLSRMSEEERAATETDDTETLDTPARARIVELWGHVYWDTVVFLCEVSPYCGEMESRTSLPLAFGTDKDRAKPVVADHVFGCNVFVIPVFITKGGSVRITRNGLNQAAEGGMEEKERELGVFDLNKNPWEIYFLRRGFKYNFYVDGVEASEGKAVSAVLAVCKLKMQEDGPGDQDNLEGKIDE
ncbi:uncharacterized protein DNG_09430 [Cephalotrichum gorgonifer]|uniref:Uncharacterized protein n=1 Tax=Cephalotrichum gorgonifer TaxID=2041049 RepID=A0AAE8SZA9_9PEZI|nr:uncharacterized protein DNG_09430 [Cephalotrichum gorgonifer]